MGALKFIAIGHSDLNWRSRPQDTIEGVCRFGANECAGAARINEDKQLLIFDDAMELDCFLA